MKPLLKTQAPPVSTPETPLPQSEKPAPKRIVVLERRSLLAGAGIVDFYQAQSLTDPALIGLAIHHGVRFHDVSSEPAPARILIRRDASIPAGRGIVQVKSGQTVEDAWVIAACLNGGASFDDISGDEAA